MERQPSFESIDTLKSLKADAIKGHDEYMVDIMRAESRGDYKEAFNTLQEASALQVEYVLTFGEEIPNTSLHEAQETLWNTN